MYILLYILFIQRQMCIFKLTLFINRRLKWDKGWKFFKPSIQPREGGGHWAVYYTGTQSLIITLFIRWLNNFGDYTELWLVGSLTWVFKRFNHYLLSTKGLILSIIIRNVHQSIGYFLIPLDPCIQPDK